MSISFTVEIVCDCCQSVFSGDPMSIPAVSDVSDKATEAGWKIDDERALCETCADNSDEARELDRADQKLDIERNDLRRVA